MNISELELNKLIREVEDHSMVQAPKNMKEAIIKRSECIEVKVMRKKNEMSKEMQLFFYSFKVVTAVFWALILLNLAGTIKPIEISEKAPTLEPRKSVTFVINEMTTEWSGSLRSASNKILNLGGLFND
ncbi:MAG: hypothetical protein PHY47_13250 [Lachnospiraceae bacterium]|nr:hypothetical protein [Lachnospiraceae bacterium]